MSSLNDDTARFIGDMRDNFSCLHFFAAAHFSARVKELEKAHNKEALGPFFHEIRFNSIAAVFTAFASVEALANELLVNWSKVVPNAPSLSNKRKEEIDKKHPLCKLNFILTEGGKPKISCSVPPGEDLELLRKLRNALIHFRPEWLRNQAEHAKLSKKLRGRFAGSPFLASDVLFPRAWASHSCTTWAVRTARSVSNLVDDRLGRERILECCETG